MPRIVSLLPSATEIVCALGFEDQLVGRSHECDFPDSVTRLPTLTSPKFDPEGTSAEIDQRVKTILSEALAVYRVDADMLRDLQPDVIVTQSQCDVCAVSMREVEDAVAQWTGAQPLVVSLAPYALGDVFTDMERVGAALDAVDHAKEVVGQLKARMRAIEDRARSVESRPRVACIEWIDPLMAAGNWMPELIAMAGGINLFGAAGEHSPWMKFEEIIAADPDVILIAPCGFNMDRTAADLPAIAARPEWSLLKAVKDRKVFLGEGNQYFNRPGPRIVESLEILSEVLHPETFSFGHKGSGWRRL
ncbi:MAG: iron complex transport system substrate-binding protein [Candidatus Binataceae bacterium]|nr:iron complex transport system substrate-binding protein [Candidatus Binataceae bacterium]